LHKMKLPALVWFLKI